MKIRIEQSTLTATPTGDPLVFRIEADVTTDGPEVPNPTFSRVGTLWNKNTPKEKISALLEAAIPPNPTAAIQEDLRAALGEAIIKRPDIGGQATGDQPATGLPTGPGTGTQVTNVYITAQAVTITTPGGKDIPAPIKEDTAGIEASPARQEGT